MKMAIAATCLLLCASPVSAQQDKPVSGFVIDARGIFARHKQEPDIAKNLDVVPANLPTRSLGVSAGAHVYPVRAGKLAFGFGGHALFAGGSKTLEPAAAVGATTAAATADLPTVQRHFRVYAAEVSFNFGHRNGWSFISGGIGRTSLYVDRKDQPASDVPLRQTFHYGAGARWFTTHHTAVSLELRWYSVGELTAGPTYTGQPRTTLLVLSGGIALR